MLNSSAEEGRKEPLTQTPLPLNGPQTGSRSNGGGVGPLENLRSVLQPEDASEQKMAAKRSQMWKRAESLNKMAVVSSAGQKVHWQSYRRSEHSQVSLLWLQEMITEGTGGTCEGHV